eukprot:gnl/Spiro4/9723_TR5172_c0_g1_i1.p1 gnl/Spiro4/9723_TR5172_c0_g1~~gnl/Spiro4/9723_TR5172_c0_g1_i1.p1  ORF type:complete len:125 (+),score=35.05 gnl/Spiro4/9723_TR5172_c0_g1_i1:40-375(+)
MDTNTISALSAHGPDTQEFTPNSKTPYNTGEIPPAPKVDTAFTVQNFVTSAKEEFAQIGGAPLHSRNLLHLLLFFFLFLALRAMWPESAPAAEEVAVAVDAASAIAGVPPS